MAEPITQDLPARPVRVLHVVQSLGLGGMEKVLVRVATALSPRGLDFHACCLTERGEQAASFPAPAQVHELGRGEGLSLRSVFRLRRLIRSIRPDVVHTHNIGPLLYSSLAKLLGAPARIVHGEHGQIRLKIGTRHEWLSRLLYKTCYRVHTVSRNQLEELRGFGLVGDAKSLAVVNGVDTDSFAPGDTGVREALGIPADARVLGVVGRMIPSKHHVRLVRAMALLGEDLHLLIVGDGPSRPEVEAEIARLDCRTRIPLTGNIRDVLSHYRAMDLLVVASDSEGLSNVMLEAMACGVPVLCNAQCHGADEVVRDGEDGWLLPMASPEETAAAIRAVLDDPAEILRRGRAARQAMLDRFSFARTVDAYEALYRDCAGGRA